MTPDRYRIQRCINNLIKQPRERERERAINDCVTAFLGIAWNCILRVIFILQVNPLKDLTEISPNEDPYVDCDPLVFKIIKKRSPEEHAKVEARKMVKLKKKEMQRSGKLSQKLQKIFVNVLIWMSFAMICLR